MIMSLRQRKIKLEPRIKLNHKIYNLLHKSTIFIVNEHLSRLKCTEVIFCLEPTGSTGTIVLHTKKKQAKLILFLLYIITKCHNMIAFDMYY